MCLSGVLALANIPGEFPGEASPRIEYGGHQSLSRGRGKKGLSTVDKPFNIQAEVAKETKLSTGTIAKHDVIEKKANVMASKEKAKANQSARLLSLAIPGRVS